jgi:hypothetical protein
MTSWQPREKLQQMAEARGWVVRRIKADDGCYKIKGLDENGNEIEVKIDPGSLAIIELDSDDEDDEVEAGSSTGQNATSPAAPSAHNSLFSDGSVPAVEMK